MTKSKCRIMDEQYPTPTVSPTLTRRENSPSLPRRQSPFWKPQTKTSASPCDLEKIENGLPLCGSKITSIVGKEEVAGWVF
jgi:hypothetical protein